MNIIGTSVNKVANMGRLGRVQFKTKRGPPAADPHLKGLL